MKLAGTLQRGTCPSPRFELIVPVIDAASYCWRHRASSPTSTVEDCYGAPLPGNTLKIFDPETAAIVPRGERGEIAIRGATLMMGYLGKAAEETFDAEGFYRTGDGGYVDEAGRLLL